MPHQKEGPGTVDHLGVSHPGGLEDRPGRDIRTNLRYINIVDDASSPASVICAHPEAAFASTATQGNPYGPFLPLSGHMCRLFASVRNGGAIDRSPLLHAFFAQSRLHPDGWGMARSVDGILEVVKEPVEASKSELLPKYMDWAKEPLLLAHIRRKSVGTNTMENTHPFLRDGWAFGHNGTLDAMDKALGHLGEGSRGRLAGTTDSEVMFALLLQEMADMGDAVEGIVRTVRLLHDERGRRTTALNFVMTNGRKLFVLNSAFLRPDHYAMHILWDQDDGGIVFSSNPIDGRAGWTSMGRHELMAVDRRPGIETIPLARG